MSDWQPIETAPKDGTEILLAERNGEDWYIFTGFFYESRAFGEWLCSEYEAFSHYPEYWMPRPESPEEI